MKVVLFRNLSEDGSQSMQRYARELGQALRNELPDNWGIEEFSGKQARIGRRLLGSKSGQRVDSALGRYVQYPLQASRVKGDLFHILDHGYAQLGLGLKPGRTIVTCHDLIPLLAHQGKISMEIPQNVALSFKFRLRCMARARLVIAVSQATKANLVQYTSLTEERIKVVWPGVSDVFRRAYTENTRRAFRFKYAIPEDARLIMHVGTNRYKNASALIRAVDLINREMNLKVWLLRIGSNFNKEEENLVENLGLQPQVVRIGNVPDDATMATYYQAADVLAFPSIWEGFGWPPLEAMACGTPVITSNVASLPEVVGKAGLMVDPQDYTALAQAIYRVLTDTALHSRLAGQGLQQAQTFSWQNTARRVATIYAQIAEQPLLIKNLV